MLSAKGTLPHGIPKYAGPVIGSMGLRVFMFVFERSTRGKRTTLREISKAIGRSVTRCYQIIEGLRLMGLFAPGGSHGIELNGRFAVTLEQTAWNGSPSRRRGAA